VNVLLDYADSTLRQATTQCSENHRDNQPTSDWRAQCAIILISGGLCGVIMGSYAGIDSSRWLHLVFVAIKVPLLLLATFLLSWPSFVVANYLVGLGADLRAAWRVLISCQVVVALLLVSLSPLTALWYVCVRDYKAALLFNAVMYLLASLAGQYAMRRSYQGLIRVNRRHRLMQWVWIGVYSFVGIQLAWVLRPFVGSPWEVVQFIRTEQMSNAYVRIAELLWVAIVDGVD